jgi:hypothetical protein
MLRNLQFVFASLSLLRQSLRRFTAATETYPKSSDILTERQLRHRRPLFCWQVVHIRYFYPKSGWFIDRAAVQNSDLRPIMRSVLITQSLADCATMILKTVSTSMGSVYAKC